MGNTSKVCPPVDASRDKKLVCGKKKTPGTRGREDHAGEKKIKGSGQKLRTCRPRR